MCRHSFRMVAVKFLIIFAAATALRASAAKYENGTKVDVYVNKVGPFFNPHETYHYYQLPVCHPEKIEPKVLTLGEVLDGDRMAMSMYEIHFKEDAENRVLCKMTLNAEDFAKLQEAIEDLYYFEFVIDDIPVRGFVGRLDESGILPHKHKIYLWTHMTFNIEYNGNQIIYANVSTKQKPALSLDEVHPPYEVSFSYSVKWHPTKMEYADRAKRVRDNTFFPKSLEVHWLSIINSMILVFLLIGFVAIILARVLKNDFSRYNVAGADDEDADDDDAEDYGWKLIHGDVFRFPPHPSLFCAVLGVGTQFLAIVTGVLIMAVFGVFGVHRHGAIDIAVILLYALTSCISGYISSNMYLKMGGESWLSNVNLTSALFTVPCVAVWAIVNTVAWIYGSTQALPWGTVILLVAVWAFVGYPLTVAGAMLGRQLGGTFDAPSRTKPVPREIPDVPWYRTPAVHCIVGGFLPFSAISVELYYIFATLWGREQFTLYGILCIVYVILLSVTACIAVALTYFQLSAEDHRWWWRSVLSAGSTSIFVLLYALFFFTKRSNMSGVLQMTEFFGYTLLACYAFCLMLGAVSFFASLRFVRYIYVNVKVD